MRQRLTPIDASGLCTDQGLGQVTDALWNRWFDSDTGPDDAHRGYLLYARSVLSQFTYDPGTGPRVSWGMVPGTLLLWGWDPASGLMAFAFYPDQPRSDVTGVAVVANSNGLIGSVDLHGPPDGSGISEANAPLGARYFSSTPLKLLAWDGTSGRIAASCT